MDININISQEGEEHLVDARTLHEKLGSKSKFADWFKNKVILNDKFIEGVDYFLLLKSEKQNGSGGSNKIDYNLTLDTATNLCMWESTDIGNDFRRFFIQSRKDLVKLQQSVQQFNIPENLGDALALAGELENKRMLLAQENKQKDLIIEEQKPAVEFKEKIVKSSTLMSMGEASKLISGYGRTRLYNFLRQHGVMGQSHRVPLQRYIDNGWFAFKVHEQDGGNRISAAPMVTGKGLFEIKNLIDKKTLESDEWEKVNLPQPRINTNLYVIQLQRISDGEEVSKIGISSNVEKRMIDFKSQGFYILEQEVIEINSEKDSLYVENWIKERVIWPIIKGYSGPIRLSNGNSELFPTNYYDAILKKAETMVKEEL